MYMFYFWPSCLIMCSLCAVNKDDGSDLPGNQRGRRRLADEDDTILDSQDASSVLSQDQGTCKIYALYR